MLWQLQIQNVTTGACEFVAQNELNEDIDTYGDAMKWVADVQSSHKLPEGHGWLLCNEEAPEFIRTQEKETQ